MKTNPEKPERKLQIMVSETKRGIIIKEKIGHILLWKKETDNRNRMYVVEIRKLICRACGHIIDFPLPKKIFRMLCPKRIRKYTISSSYGRVGLGILTHKAVSYE